MNTAEMFTHGEAPKLDEVLLNRERRVQFIGELLRCFSKSCMISLKCNIPGPIKSSGEILALFDYGENRIHEILSNQSWQPNYQRRLSLYTRLEALWVIPRGSLEVKRNTILFEEEELGGLFDADVLDQKDGFVWTRSKVELGYEPRRCLICDQGARICASRWSHPVSTLQQRLVQLLTKNVRRLEKSGPTQ